MGEHRSRREQILDATVNVLAEQGLRNLTHRRIDETASAPQGSTSNYFPSRQALVVAAVRHISEWITRSGALIGDVSDDNAEDALLALFRQQVTRGITDWWTPVLAWNRITFELPAIPEVRDVVIEIRNGGIKAYSDLLQRCGSTTPEQHALLILSFVKGVISRQYVFPDPDFDATEALRPLLDGMLNRASTSQTEADTRG